MSLLPAVPRSVAAILERQPVDGRHPGLQLDKFAPIWGATAQTQNQELQKSALDQTCKTCGDDSLLKALSERRTTFLAGMQACTWSCKTTGPLTLHLARASALENAGICLHPIYGFVYLPGSGLKGMARAFAETMWLPGQADQAAAWGTIEQVFGWAPFSDQGKTWRPCDAQDHSGGNEASVGSIVFHEAWPKTWPKLTVDITNCHHQKYYSASDREIPPPGDWEEPIPVYFLAAKPGVLFHFAVSKQRDDVSDDLLTLARSWLEGALCHVGAGAKTNAGYGAFVPVEGKRPEFAATDKRAVFETEVELVTPAFLAGASQQQADCDLRPATLRGLLRWWWRTMHAGWLAPSALRRLESHIWGDTKNGGAVRLEVEAVAVPAAGQYAKRDHASFTPAQKTSPLGIDGCDPRKTTQGLWYLSFGMDDADKHRFFASSGARWRVRISSRDTPFDGAGRLSAADLRDQALAALCLLCRFGGVGAKSGKGFGAFVDLPNFDLEDCKRASAKLRALIGQDGRRCPAQSPCLEDMVGPFEVPTSWEVADAWFALDQLGFSAQAFAKSYKHDKTKRGLGLPRSSQRWLTGIFDDHQLKRHTSPARFHLARLSSGKLAIRIVAFPSQKLHSETANRALLNALCEHLKSDLSNRAAINRPPRRALIMAAAHQSQPGMHQAAPRIQRPPSTGPKAGEKVEAVLLAETTRKGGRKARHESSGLEGPIQNTSDVPADKKAGETVTLVIASVRLEKKEADFRWPK